MNLYDNQLYMDDVRFVAAMNLPWEKLNKKSILLSGATGMIGSFLVDVLMEKNQTGLECKVYALGRNEAKAKQRFSKHIGTLHFVFIPYDVNFPLEWKESETAHFILHLASNTHPVQYATDPIGTINANIIGTQNLLKFGATHHIERFLFASSNEIYGENRGDVDFFDENYCGYINSNTMRAGYPESKRCGEALCQAYKAQCGVDVVIPRLTRSYGPTMLMSDTKAVSQFIKKGLAGENVILKSSGSQFFSFQYVADSVSGLLTVLLCGGNGEAYNIAEKRSDITLRDLALLIAETTGTKVVFEMPEALEAAGFSTATKARLDGHKLAALGWKPKYDIRTGIQRTVSILRSGLNDVGVLS